MIIWLMVICINRQRQKTITDHIRVSVMLNLISKYHHLSIISEPHLPSETATADEPETHKHTLNTKYEGLDEHVKTYLDDMAKPGARTTWMGWFPTSFTRMLTSSQIPTKKAHELALSIRSTITNGGG